MGSAESATYIDAIVGMIAVVQQHDHARNAEWP